MTIGQLKLGAKISQVETKIWMSPREGLSMEEAVNNLKALGNQVLEIDYENRQILVSHTIDKTE